MSIARVLLIYAVVALAACGLLIDPPWRQKDPVIAWLVSCVGASLLAFVAAITASVLHVHYPLWLGLAVLAGLDAAITWVLVMLIRARRKGRREGAGR